LLKVQPKHLFPRSLLLAGMLALSLLVSAVLLVPVSTAAASEVTLNGDGSSYDATLIETWVAVQNAPYNLSVNYSSSDS
jgi:hypothetical protein